MSGVVKADAEQLMLSELQLPATRVMWSSFAERADTEDQPAARFLSMLMEHEVAEREQRRLARFLSEAHLLPSKSLDDFDFSAVPMISKAHFSANQLFGKWGKVFPDPAMTVAAVDRLVHHAVIVEMNDKSYRRREAKANRAKGPERPATRTTKKNIGNDAA